MRKTTGAGKRLLSVLSTAALLAASVGWLVSQSHAQDESKNETDIQKRIQNAADVLNQIMADKDKAIPDKIMSSADCVAVVPSMVKIAIGFGGEHGKGVATCRTKNGWSAPAPFTITGGSWGLQIGGEAVDLVLLAMQQKGMDDLLSSKFKLGAGVSAAAGPVGREGEAATDWKMKAELLTYSRARGVFAGIDLSGAKVAQDRDETAVLYGKMIPYTRLLSGEVPPPSGSEPFLAAVRKYARQANEQGKLSNAPASSGTH
jgi:SH3 domain-containing YSC84-like protein 1